MTTARPTPSHRSSLLAVLTALAAVLATTLTPSASWSAAAPRTTSPVASSAPAAPVVRSAAVGKLAPSGCASSGGVAQCDLWAMTGTTQLLGQSVPIWGFSSSSAPGTATAPGPVLVVRQGDQVSITVHNGLTQNLSLALPGQPATDVTEGLSVLAQSTGAAPGGTRTYSFTANRPGTFAYEAGHTADGARQVAMGLAGALVVQRGDATASGRAYDDEQVVVLSDFDPQLNAHPNTFDMRGYRARWRLINGKPFPSTTPIATDQGHTVLLRYVNVGAVSHPMSLLGATQLELAQDGHDLPQAQRLTVAEMDAGSTLDSLVTMPSGPDSRITLFEAGSHLDNVGATELDPTQVATGGMLTFLDTNAPPPTTDVVGPVASQVKVTPSTSAGTAPVSVQADLSDVRTGGSNLLAAEFVVDDPSVAVGSGITLSPDTAYSSSDAHVTGSIPVAPLEGLSCTPDSGPVPVTLQCLSAGKHIVYVRGEDAALNWGVVGSVVLNLPKSGPLTRDGSSTPAPANTRTTIQVSTTGDDTAAAGVVDGAELFLDSVGANGTGVAMTLNRSADVVSEDLTIPADLAAGQTCQSTPVVAACLTEGTHHLWVHSHDSLGLWGPPLDLPLTADKTGPSVDAAAVSPNPTNTVLASPGNAGYLRVSASISDRVLPSGALQGTVTRAEGFFAPSSTTPTPGTGFALLPDDGTWNSSTETVYGLIPLSQVKPKADGSYQVYVRGKDDAGNWGTLFAIPLVVDKTAPVLGSLSATPNPTAGAAQLVLSATVTGDTTFQTAELWTGATDPGVGKATRVSVGLVGGRAVVTVPLATYPPGATTFNLRVQDMAGNWSNAVATTVTVSAPAGADLLSDGFVNDTSAWSSVTGSPSVTTGAGLMPSDGINKGLSVPLPGGGYVTDNSPTSEPSYHARFDFSGVAMRISSGNTTAVTIFEARSATGSVYSVQVGRNGGGTGAPNRIRVVMSRSGAGAVTGGWVTLSAGPHRIQTDWQSGPATGAGQGTLRLGLDGTTVATLTGNTSTLRVESVRLGLIAGLAATWTGAAYLDGFTSSRTSVG